jgi:CBS domain containing-hemolysin-like protein
MTVMILQGISFLLLLTLSAFFSGSEIVFASANKVRLRMAAQQGKRGAVLAEYILNHFTSFLSAILLGNNLVNISLSALGTLVAASLLTSDGLAQTIATAVVTLFLLTFGEVFPKIIGAQFSDELVTAIAYPLRFFLWLFYPIVKPVGFLVGKLEKLWTPTDTAPSVTPEELVTIVDEMEEEGGFTEEEGDLIRSAIEYSELTAKDILTPRVDIFAFDLQDGLDNLLQQTDILSYSRFPVYEGNLDTIIGILSTKDLVRAYLKDGEKTDIRSLLKKPFFVHMTRDISSILPEMKENECEMAVVLDEFGGTLGILTAEDIVEQIVGEIYDEGDEVEQPVVAGDHGLEIDGSMNIHDFLDELGISDSDFNTEYTTVGGFAAERLNKLPEQGDSFTFGKVKIQVAEVQGNRVEKLIVQNAEAPSPTPSASASSSLE